MLKTVLYTSIFILLLITSSCNTCSRHPSTADNEDATLDFESINVIDSIDAVFYALPSPEEIISYIRDHKVPFNPRLLHSCKDAKLYPSNEKKTLMLGVYFADIAYISAFKKSDFSPEYIATIDYLLKDLNINPDFSEDQTRKIATSIMNPDSLYALSHDLYDTVISYLQEHDKGKTLSLLSVGTITESLFLSTHLHKDFETQKDAINKIAEQQLLFQDIVTMMQTYKENTGIQQLIRDLYVLEKSFENLKIKSEVTNIQNNPDGSINIEGNTNYNFTEENYFIFMDNIQDFRTRLIKL
jgi:hypothetical protein